MQPARFFLIGTILTVVASQANAEFVLDTLRSSKGFVSGTPTAICGFENGNEYYANAVTQNPFCYGGVVFLYQWTGSDPVPISVNIRIDSTANAKGQSCAVDDGLNDPMVYTPGTLSYTSSGTAYDTRVVTDGGFDYEIIARASASPQYQALLNIKITILSYNYGPESLMGGSRFSGGMERTRTSIYSRHSSSLQKIPDTSIFSWLLNNKVSSDTNYPTSLMDLIR